MPWSAEHNPASMRHLGGVTRSKALAIADAQTLKGPG